MLASYFQTRRAELPMVLPNESFMGGMHNTADIEQVWSSAQCSGPSGGCRGWFLAAKKSSFMMVLLLFFRYGRTSKFLSRFLRPQSIHRITLKSENALILYACHQSKMQRVQGIHFSLDPKGLLKAYI